MSKESWYAGKPEDIIRIDASDDFVVDYDKSRGMYRVSVFDDGHFWDEFWFDAYEENELDNSFPQTIGSITYYSKAELFEWVKNQQMALSIMGAYEQIKWERDIALEQLGELGLSFGQKIEGVYLSKEEHEKLLEYKYMYENLCK